MTDRASRITVRRYASAADADKDDLAFWKQPSDAERVLQAWRLSEEVWPPRSNSYQAASGC